MVPLVPAAFQRQHSQALASTSGLRRATEKLQQMRQVIKSVSTIPELEQRMAALQGPRLDAADRTLPLPVLRSRMEDLLDQASTRLARARNASPPASPWALLGDIARTSVACLAVAAGFAGLAQRPHSELSLLIELEIGWEELRYNKFSLRRTSRGTGTSDEDYIQQLSGEQDGG